MDIELVTRFFMWCTVLNVGLLFFMFLMTAFAGDFIYRMHTKWYSLPRETFNVVLYAFIGVYKVLVFVFSLVPWIALEIIR